MAILEMTFKQYNKEQELLTRRHQERLAHNRDICLKGVVKVKKNEVIENLKKLGFDKHWNTVLNWERGGLLPKSKMIGKEKDFPDSYPSEVFASYCQKEFKIPDAKVAAARKIASTIEKDPGQLLSNSNFPGNLEDYLAINRLIDKSRAENGILENDTEIRFERKGLEWTKKVRELKGFSLGNIRIGNKKYKRMGY